MPLLPKGDKRLAAGLVHHTIISIKQNKNMEDQLKIIREACIKANPSILDLVFGCEIITNKENKVTILNKGNGTEGEWFTYLDENGLIGSNDQLGEPVYIIGRKIGIAEILYAIGKIQKRASYYLEVGSGRFIKSESVEYGVSKDIDTGIYYNLLDDDITRQSPECVAFIANLLGNEAVK